MHRAVVFFPHNPLPVRTGAHARCISLLTALRDLGWSTVLLSTDYAHNEWTSASISELRSSYVRDVRVHTTSEVEWKLRGFVTRWTNARAKLGRPALDSWHVVSPGQQVWARRETESLSPDAILSSYAHYDGAVPHFDFLDVQRIIDNIDLVSASQRMWSIIGPALSSPRPLVTAAVPDDVLTFDFLADAQGYTSAREMRLYDRYTDVLAISQAEATRIAAATSRTKVHYVPMTASVTTHERTYAANPVFVGAPNPFNLQGLLWFARHVLPKVQATHPAFELDVVGATFVPWQPDPGINLLGTVVEIDDVYARAPFAVCPLLAGTGEQVKIIDAMAHGLPVVATRQTASSSPIIDGVNGYVVDSAGAFAERVAELWADRVRCRALGEAALDRIAADYSPSRTTAELGAILRD